MAIALRALFLLTVSGTAIWLTPNVVRYQESIVIRAPTGVVYDAIRWQRDLMQWSAWPAATGSTCDVEHADGEMGARTVFFSNGKRFGFQEVVALVPDRQIDLEIHSAGPPQRPRLNFILQSLDADATRVTIDWTNTISRPFHVPMHLAGIVRWTRQMHRKDLEGLKQFCEIRYGSAGGEPHGRLERDAAV